MSDNKRPAWDMYGRPRMSEAEFRMCYELLAAISVRMETRSDGFGRESWTDLIATLSDGRDVKMPLNWNDALELKRSCTGLFGLTWHGDEMLKIMQKIDYWEEQNKQDRLEYSRLRKKFRARARDGDV
jgi:hypothetical protein